MAASPSSPKTKSASPGPVAWAVPFLLIVAIGLVVVSTWRSLQRLRDTADEQLARDTPTLVNLAEENQRLASGGSAGYSAGEAANVPIPDESGPDRAAGLEFVAGLVANGFIATPRSIGANQPNAPQVAYRIDANGIPGDQFGEFFNLSADEQAALRSGLAAVMNRVESELLSSAAVRREGDGSVVIEISPLPNASAYREQYSAVLREALGQSRYETLARLSFGTGIDITGPMPASTSGNQNLFGELSGTYTFQITPNGYNNRFTFQGPSSRGTGGSASGNGTSGMFEKLSQQYGPITQLLPAEFRQ